MEVDSAPEASGSPERHIYSVSLLKIVHDAQRIHGLKHSEYSRYRQYCSRRLRRIYKGVKFLHGRGRYQAKRLDADTVTDERYLHVPLVSAERAWAHAMDLKNQVEQSAAPSKRHHLIRRLSKATTHATHLSTLASSCCDPRSSLEAEAYSLWMTGNLLLEKETDWEKALASFLKAGKILEELSRLGDVDQRATCRYFLDQVDPAVRFCRYQISRKAGGKGEGGDNAEDLLASIDTSTVGGDVIQSKLAALASEAQATRATGAFEFEWEGEKLPVTDDRCRLALHAAKELEAALPKVPEGVAASQEDVEAAVAAYDKCINAYVAARSAVKAAMQMGRQGADAETHQAELKDLDRAVHVLELQHTVQRNLCLAENAAARVDKAWKLRLSGSKTKDKDRPARPEDVARLYDTLCSNATELNDVAAAVGGAKGEALLDDCTAKIAHYQAVRCFHVAQSHLEANSWLKAAALLERSLQRLDEAIARYKECSVPDERAVSALNKLKEAASALQAIPVAEVHAETVRESEPVQSGIQGLALDGSTAAGSKKDGYLQEDSSVWAAFAGDTDGAPPRICRVPPAPEAVPVRPIVLDTAMMCVEPPDLSGRVPKKAAGAAGAGTAAGATGMVSRLFGW